jgi:Rv0078B-related antitoxin
MAALWQTPAVSPEQHRRAAANLLAALRMYDPGVAMKRAQLRREDTLADEQEITRRVNRWLRTRPGAEYGDAEGKGTSYADELYPDEARYSEQAPAAAIAAALRDEAAAAPGPLDDEHADLAPVGDDNSNPDPLHKQPDSDNSAADDDERSLLTNRLAEYRADPSSARRWEDVRESLIKPR